MKEYMFPIHQTNIHS